MIICGRRFNIYLASALVMFVALGCQSLETKKKKEEAVFRAHIETNPDASDRVKAIPIYRAHPILVNIDSSPVLNETMIADAQVVDTIGGFSLSIQLDRKGTWLLEQLSNESRGKRLAIFCQFATPTGNGGTDGRWLAAPLLLKRISDGVIVFTPDATREEADQIALGLRNTAKHYENDQK